MANYSTMVWFESWWNTLLHIEDPVVRDDRTRRVMEYGFHKVKNLDGLDVDGRAFMEEIFAKMDDMNKSHDKKIASGKVGGQKGQKYDYDGLGVRQMFIDGLAMTDIAKKTGIPYDSIRRWSGREEAEQARRDLLTGKSFPVDSSQASERGKDFPIKSFDIPEDFSGFESKQPESLFSGGKDSISESGKTGKSNFPVDSGDIPENSFSGDQGVKSEWNPYGF